MFSLVQDAQKFRTILDAARKRLAPRNFEWYPYNSLSSAHHIETLLGGAHGYVLERGRGKGILDLGSGDGDFAFFLESLGFPVTAVDYGASNQNGMEGLRTLHRELGSRIAIRDIDVDNEFPLEAKYGLTLCLGLLYHLKNPFFVLEHLARISEFCILSTRIARRLPGGAAMPDKHPLAYLVGEDELNQDDTNYWIFSEPGLRRLLERTRWEIVEFLTTGDTLSSDPVSADRDERAFCLLRSHYGLQHLDLLEGWHHIEHTGWRWTKKQFAARARNYLGLKHSRIAMRVYVPPLLIEKFGAISLRARIDDADVQPLTMREPGIHTFVRAIPKPSDATSVVFELDNVIAPDEGYERELGIIVASLEFE